MNFLLMQSFLKGHVWASTSRIQERFVVLNSLNEMAFASVTLSFSFWVETASPDTMIAMR